MNQHTRTYMMRVHACIIITTLVFSLLVSTALPFAMGLESTESPPVNASIGLNQTDLSVKQGDTFHVAVIANASVGTPDTEIYGAQFTLHYNTTVLNATSIQNGSFLGSSTITAVQRINHSIGKIDFAATRVGVTNGSTGSGALAVLSFAVRDNAPSGATPLLFTDVIFANTSGATIATEIINATVTVNAPPVASFTYSPSNPMMAQMITFDAGVSHDPDGSISTAQWSFGDGSEATGSHASHTYAEAGIYTVTLTITDNQGAIATRSQSIEVAAFNQPPDQPTVVSPGDGAPATDLTITLSWACTDPDGDALTYDVHLGTTPSPPVVAANITTASYTPTLHPSTTYYWAIQAWDSHGAHTMSNQWQFTTQTPSHYNVVTQSRPASGGTVTLTPAGGSYARGTSVKVTAQAASGFVFDSWSGGLSGATNPVQITVTTNMTVTAHFARQNQPPTVTIESASSNATRPDVLVVEGTATDSDGTVAEVEARMDSGLWQPAAGTTSWQAMLNLTDVSSGDHTVYARSYDGTDYSSLASFSISLVAGDDNEPPTVTITTPLNGTTIEGIVNVTGTANDSDGVIQFVQLQVDSTGWITVHGTSQWTYTWNTTMAPEGLHTLQARSYDGQAYSPVSSVAVTIDHTDDEATPGFTLLILVAAAALVIWFTRKH